MKIGDCVLFDTFASLIALAIYLENGGSLIIYVSAPIIDHNGNYRRSL